MGQRIGGLPMIRPQVGFVVVCVVSRQCVQILYGLRFRRAGSYPPRLFIRVLRCLSTWRAVLLGSAVLACMHF